MRRGFGIFESGFDVQKSYIVQKSPFVRLDEIKNVFAGFFGVPDYFVFNVRYIHDQFDPETRSFQNPARQVFKNISAQIAYVREIVNSRPAGVNTGGFAFGGLERLNFTAQKVENPHRCG